MTTLTEFLATADTDNTVALGQARAFSEQVLKPLDERMVFLELPVDLLLIKDD